MAADDDTPWYRSLVVGLGAMLGVAVLVGGLIGVVALGAANVAGLGDDQPSADEQATLYIPERTSSDRPDEDEDGPSLEDLGGVDPTASASAETKKPQESKKKTEKKPDKKKDEPKNVISLSASPLQVGQMERIYLTGTYPGGGGTSLQVQRLQGSWSDFPVSTSVSGGTFSTYVQTGRSGTNKFRVLDPSTGKTSNPVTIQVR